MTALWENAWPEFIPFLDCDGEIRKVLCSTNAIEALNARNLRAVKARGHFLSGGAKVPLPGHPVSGHKLPRFLAVVDKVPRHVSGEANYLRAKELVMRARSGS